MRTKHVVIAALLFCRLAAHPALAQQPVNPAQAQSLQNKIDSFIQFYTIPGISVSVLLPGNYYWNGAAGRSHIYNNKPMDTTLLFQQASVGKTFTATLVFLLAEQNFFSLDDSIGRYLPPIKHVPGSTTIRNLLSQRSGLADIISHPNVGDTWFSYPDSIWPPALTIETYGGNPLYEQGTSFNYANTNYILLGMLVEKVTGNSFATELRNRICLPYGLTKTFFTPFETVAGPETPGWTSFSTPGVYDTDASLILNDCSASMFFAAGAIVALPKDVARFIRLLHTGKILRDTSLTLMKQCTNVNMGSGCNGYGYGCMRYVLAGRTCYGHAGDVNGFTLLSVHLPSDSITISICINRNGAARGPMATTLLSTIIKWLASGTGPPGKETTGKILHLYPNPAADQVHIHFPDMPDESCQLELYNAAGQLITPAIVEQPEHSLTDVSWNISALPPGMYMAHLRSRKTSVYQKFIVYRK